MKEARNTEERREFQRWEVEGKKPSLNLLILLLERPFLPITGWEKYQITNNHKHKEKQRHITIYYKGKIIEEKIEKT